MTEVDEQGIFEARGFSGAYIITHVASGKVYVGSSEDLRRRQRRHVVNLRRGIHENIHFQRVYRDDPALQFYSWFTEDIEDAKQLEQQLLDLHKSSGKLLNISLESVNSRKGVIARAETRQKISETRKRRLDLMEAASQLGKSNAGRTHPPEIRAKMNELWGRPVFAEGVNYPTLVAAASALKVCPATIKNRCVSPMSRWTEYRFLV